MKKTVIKILFFIVICSLLQWGTHKATDGFAIEKICSSLSYRPEWQVEEPSAEQFKAISARLDQKFSYLGKGAQCFVFLSEDGKSVLKFFRHSHMRAPFWLTLFPFPGSFEKYRQEKIVFHTEKLLKDFASYKIAFEELREYTGIVYLHLNKTQLFHKHVTIVDKLGIAHSLDLDQMEFMLQKKATLVYPAIETLLSQGKLIEAKKALTSLVSLLVHRCKKGIFDKDPDLNSNFGFIGTDAIQIDIGRFKKDEQEASPDIYRDELIRITDHLHQWLSVRSAELNTHLLQEINRCTL